MLNRFRSLAELRTIVRGRGREKQVDAWITKWLQFVEHKYVVSDLEKYRLGEHGMPAFKKYQEDQLMQKVGIAASQAFGETIKQRVPEGEEITHKILVIKAREPQETEAIRIGSFTAVDEGIKETAPHKATDDNPDRRRKKVPRAPKRGNRKGATKVPSDDAGDIRRDPQGPSVNRISRRLEVIDSGPGRRDGEDAQPRRKE